MLRIIERFIAILLCIVFVTFLVNHGQIDFSGVDFVVSKTKDAVNSEQGKEIVNEFKDITSDVFTQFSDETKKILNDVRLSKTRTPTDLVRVVDGDTIIVEYNGEEMSVRLIGIDTPESVNEDETKNNIYGEMASEHTKELLSGVNKVYLEFDAEMEDVYGRILAYVWLTAGENNDTTTIGNEMLNGIILKDGYAKNKVYGDNDRYETSFSNICNTAEGLETGLWSEEGFRQLWE